MATSEKPPLQTAMNGWLSAVRVENQFGLRETRATLPLSPKLALPSAGQIVVTLIKTCSYHHS